MMLKVRYSAVAFVGMSAHIDDGSDTCVHRCNGATVRRRVMTWDTRLGVSPHEI